MPRTEWRSGRLRPARKPLAEHANGVDRFGRDASERNLSSLSCTMVASAAT